MPYHKNMTQPNLGTVRFMHVILASCNTVDVRHDGHIHVQAELHEGIGFKIGIRSRLASISTQAWTSWNTSGQIPWELLCLCITCTQNVGKVGGGILVYKFRPA